MDNATPDSAPAPAKPRGRPTGDTPALTAAQRQRAYRQRQMRQRIEAAGGNAPAAGRVALLQQLSSALGQVEATDGEQKEGAQLAARRLMREIVTRYDLDLSDF